MIEEKLNLEKDITELKHQYKVFFNKTDDAKKEYNAIIEAIERNKKIVEGYKAELAEVNNDISSARLNWMLEKEEELQKMANKITEAENAIKRAGKLDEKEIQVKEIEARAVVARNEQRQLELKNESDRVLNEDIKKQLEGKNANFEKRANEFAKQKEDFKEEINNFIKKWLQTL